MYFLIKEWHFLNCLYSSILCGRWSCSLIVSFGIVVYHKGLALLHGTLLKGGYQSWIGSKGGSRGYRRDAIGTKKKRKKK